MARSDGVKNRGNGAAKEKASNSNIVANETGNQRTDYSRWRLLDEAGCQTWHYLQTDEEVKEWPQTIADKYHLGMDTVIDHFYSLYK